MDDFLKEFYRFLGVLVPIALVYIKLRSENKSKGHQRILDNQKDIMKQLNLKVNTVDCKAEHQIEDTEIESINSRLEGKRNSQDCVDFRARIGKESQDHYTCINRIERALVFLVTKAGGNPNDLGLK